MPKASDDLFQRAAGGDPAAMSKLYSELYPEIKRVARARLAQAGGVTGLNATALVHEGFMRMAEREGLQGDTRVQFFAYVGKVLRSIVIDFVRARDAEKRGGGNAVDAVAWTMRLTACCRRWMWWRLMKRWSG